MAMSVGDIFSDVDVDADWLATSVGDIVATLNGPHSNKTCLRGFRQSEIQTRLLSYRLKFRS